MTHTLNGSFMTKRHILDKKKKKLLSLDGMWAYSPWCSYVYSKQREVNLGIPSPSRYASVPKITVVMTLLENLYFS